MNCRSFFANCTLFKRPEMSGTSVRILFVVISLAITSGIYAQSKGYDTAFVSTATQQAKLAYGSYLGVGSHLLNGVAYKEYIGHHDDEGNPYFVSDDWVDGSLVYDGDAYAPVPIIYDLVQEKIVIEHPFAGIKLELINEKISSFDLSGHHFIRLESDTIKESPVRTGFYDVLYNGTTKFLVKRQKAHKEQVVGREIKVQFPETDRLLLHVNGRYVQVKSKSSVLEAFADRKTELRKYMHKNKIRFRNRESDITQLAAYYDELNKGI